MDTESNEDINGNENNFYIQITQDELFLFAVLPRFINSNGTHVSNMY